MIPQMIDTNAPTKKAIAVQNLNSVRKAMIKNIIPTKIKHIIYSSFKKDMAP